jgi:DNA ligase-1
MTGKARGGFSRLAALIDQLALTPSRNAKLKHLVDYLQSADDDRERGWTMAVLTGELEIETVSAGKLRQLAKARTDEQLFQLSYDYVGDMAETVSLIWPTAGEKDLPISLHELIKSLRDLTPLETMPFLDRFLDRSPPTERWAFVKLVTGASLRIGVSARLAKTALAQWSGRELEEIEKAWGIDLPPYPKLFQWLGTEDPAPVSEGVLYYHPLLLANPLEEKDLREKAPGDYWAEWKWDGIRVQWASSRKGKSKLFSRTGEDISGSFPDIVNGPYLDVVADGECLVRRAELDFEAPPSIEGIFPDIAPFQDLQKRLGRKAPSSTILAEAPAFLCLYDLLMCDGEDLRTRPLTERRARLEQWFEANRLADHGFRLSPLLPIESWEALDQLRARTREWNLEGFMIKRRDSDYRSGRPQGYWYKWKRDPLLVDAVLLYAQRGHGKRSSFYSDYTFGVWSGPPGMEGSELVPVGKAYSGFSDEELKKLDKWIRDNTVDRYGASVRAVKPELVFEVAFDALQPSTRHRSGVAMRFPRIHRIRWDKPASEADTLKNILQLLPNI